MWFQLPDGVGRWCFTTPGDLGPPLFYPFMAQQGLTLAFECLRWDQPVVVLDPYCILCWCPAGYIWPFCMFCQRFCFPYEATHCHRKSKKHLEEVGVWQARGNKFAKDRALKQQPKFSIFCLG